MQAIRFAELERGARPEVRGHLGRRVAPRHKQTQRSTRERGRARRYSDTRLGKYALAADHVAVSMPDSGRGLGARDFTWTAALYLLEMSHLH